MHRTVIVARIKPMAEAAVAEVFGNSDATSLPYELGVEQRSLYSLNDIYLHVVDFREDPVETLRRATDLPGFRQISAELRPFISPYDPNWAKPQDAVAREFYRWTPADSSVHFRHDRS
ncbi:polyketide synthase [Longispora fulva]|uniref:Cyclase n=1 Tax=Longispora fulva TaxID=619741 RepID=A0A8J7KUS4_9ACTN|nr:TcmI family type II polyketide cyclase [Longispora fulva]MBG6134372.1 cyclase [Longispora fulva]GIG63081.1 polyketide synthase [Longispora fulva]